MTCCECHGCPGCDAEAPRLFGMAFSNDNVHLAARRRQQAQQTPGRPRLVGAVGGHLWIAHRQGDWWQTCLQAETRVLESASGRVLEGCPGRQTIQPRVSVPTGSEDRDGAGFQSSHLEEAYGREDDERGCPRRRRKPLPCWYRTGRSSRPDSRPSWRPLQPRTNCGRWRVASTNAC